MSFHRELNPQLFGTQSPVEKIGQTVDTTQPAQGIMGRSPAMGAGATSAGYAPIETKALEHQVGNLKVAMIQMEKKTDAIISKMDDLARNVHGRLERFSQAIVRLEEIQNQQHQEDVAVRAQIVARVNERKVSDTKVQELMDRHNSIIRNFENRLLSLQRLASEQEMALHNATAALEEARAELSRRK